MKQKYSIGIMEGPDINDSNCIDFSEISKVRDPSRLVESKISTTSLKNVRVGIVQEFDIEELDDRNRAMQAELMALLKDQGAIPV
jgi:Asp-tRNA(Asn)/Glu-tRNA(Gln) amidotransferase A subunit family amidase